MPEKPHCIGQLQFQQEFTMYSHQFPISSLAHLIVLVKMTPGCEHDVNVIGRKLETPAVL
jgi:hypothetical protein